jgi:elongator complex protein 3
MVTEDDRLLGFLRLTIPNKKYRDNHFINELKNSSIIREVHVYGKALKLHDIEGVQHQGFGKRLIKIAEKITIEHEINRISVISAVGTRNYYKKLGFEMGELYMSRPLSYLRKQV